MDILKSSITTVLLILIGVTTVKGQTWSHDYPVGMFRVYSAGSSLSLDTQLQDLSKINKGDSSGWEAANVVFGGYRIFSITDEWEKIINEAEKADLKVIVDVRFRGVDEYMGNNSANDSLDSDEKTEVKNTISDLNSRVNENYIKGWYIADEPSAQGVSTNAVKSLRSTIKKVSDKPTYISRGTDIAGSKSNPPLDLDDPFGAYLSSDSIYNQKIIINYYHYNNNQEYTGFEDDDTREAWRPWYEESTECTRDGYGTIRGFSYIYQQAVKDLGSLEGVHLMLVAGEQTATPEDDTDSCGDKPRTHKTYESWKLAEHGLTHAAMRTAYELGFEGIWFYDWRSLDETKEDAVYHWTTGNSNRAYYAEVLENEIHHFDRLLTYAVDEKNNYGKIYLSKPSNDQHIFAGDNKWIESSGNGDSLLTHIVAGDLYGNEGSDETHIIDTDESRKSNADGDDEFITGFNSEEIWIDGELRKDLDEGNGIQDYTLDYNFVDFTAGDFDGDADEEIITVDIVDNDVYARVDGQSGYDIPLGYIDNKYTITEMIAADVENLGRDQLIVAVKNINNDNTIDIKIYKGDIAIIGDWSYFDSDNVIYSASNQYQEIKDMVGADFDEEDNTSQEQLVTSFTTTSSSSPNELFLSNKLDNSSIKIRSSRIWSSNFGDSVITALAAGNFVRDGDDRDKKLITAFWNKSVNRSSGFRGQPEKNKVTNHYKLGTSTWWHAKDMTTGSYQESIKHKSINVPYENYADNIDNVVSRQPSDYSLSQNYPNPFNPVTTIEFSIPEATHVEITVFNVMGRKVATLADSHKDAGHYSVRFDASNLASGVYIYRIKTNNYNNSKQMILLK